MFGAEGFEGGTFAYGVSLENFRAGEVDLHFEGKWCGVIPNMSYRDTASSRLRGYISSFTFQIR